MNLSLLKEGIREIIAESGNLIIDYGDKAIALWLKMLQEDCPAYYSVVYADNDYISEYKMFVPLTTDQVNEIKQAAIIDGEEWDYDEVLDQFAESDFLRAEGPCGDLIPTQIDLDHCYHLYGADVAVFRQGLHDKPEILKRSVELSDEEYIWLVRKYLVYPETSFNEIRRLNPDLYHKICGILDSNIESGVVQGPLPAYTADLTQIRKDAAELKNIIDEVKG